MSDEEAVLDNADQGGLLLSKRDVSDEMMIDFPSIPSICEKIYTKLGPGYSERVYHNCVEVELRNLGVPYETERIVPIVYDGHTVGNLRSDIIINKSIVLEFKAGLAKLGEKEPLQTRNYLKLTGLRHGYLINFGSKNLECRLIESENVSSTQSTEPRDGIVL